MKSLPGKLSSPALNILEKPLKYYVFVAGALILLLLIIFISGTIKKRTSQHEINQILTEQSMQMIAQTTNNIQRTRDVSAYTPTQTFSFFTLTPTHTPTPTLMPTPLITDTPTPTATSTQACEYTLVFRLIAVLNTNTLQLTYDTPIYLTPYLMENSTFKDQLDIPGFIVRLNGRETTNYKIFMREPLMPTVLYLQIQALPGDTVEIEIIPPGPRLCSLPYVVIDYNNVPTNTGVNTAVPTPTTTE